MNTFKNIDLHEIHNKFYFDISTALSEVCIIDDFQRFSFYEHIDIKPKSSPTSVEFQGLYTLLKYIKFEYSYINKATIVSDSLYLVRNMNKLRHSRKSVTSYFIKKIKHLLETMDINFIYIWFPRNHNPAGRMFEAKLKEDWVKHEENLEKEFDNKLLDFEKQLCGNVQND